eukprot:1291345-Rhodomonas_salina.1
MMQRILDDSETQLEFWNGIKPAALRRIFFKDPEEGGDWLGEFVQCIAKCEEAIVKLVKATSEEK